MSRYALYDGSLVDLTNFDFKIDIDIIAHHLSKIQRFNGALPIDKTYSVAEHCINLANYFLENTEIQEWCESHYISHKRLALHALLHDASEALVGDMISPLKEKLPDYKDIEKQVQFQILYQLDLWDANMVDIDFIKLIHSSDKRILLDEVISIMPDRYSIYKREIELQPLGCRIISNNRPSYIKNQFIKLYKELLND